MQKGYKLFYISCKNVVKNVSKTLDNEDQKRLSKLKEGRKLSCIILFYDLLGGQYSFEVFELLR